MITRVLPEKIARHEAKERAKSQHEFRLEWALLQEQKKSEKLYRLLREEEKRNEELFGALETSRKKCRETKAKLVNKTLSEEIELRSIKNVSTPNITSVECTIEREMITLWYIDSTGRQLVKIYKDTPMSMPLVNFREIHPNTFSKTGSYSYGNTIKSEVPLIFDDDTPESRRDEVTGISTVSVPMKSCTPEHRIDPGAEERSGLTTFYAQPASNLGMSSRSQPRQNSRRSRKWVSDHESDRGDYMKWFSGEKEKEELLKSLQKEQATYQKLEVDYQDLLERFEALQMSSLRSEITSVDGIMTPDTTLPSFTSDAETIRPDGPVERASVILSFIYPGKSSCDQEKALLKMYRDTPMSEALSHYRRKHPDVTFKTRGSRKNSGQYVDIFETDTANSQFDEIHVFPNGSSPHLIDLTAPPKGWSNPFSWFRSKTSKENGRCGVEPVVQTYHIVDMTSSNAQSGIAWSSATAPGAIAETKPKISTKRKISSRCNPETELKVVKVRRGESIFGPFIEDDKPEKKASTPQDEPEEQVWKEYLTENGRVFNTRLTV
ncbi:hypothetical protein D6C78_04023 [Aureobasidium pullulans]|uniref:Uncharacterized protein n=1 Tax=Aureobasidium pullulans TaxID=5580 RepID=A0A4T0BU86_AURPU|nr:hypothetical protein D6C78_04023 [Aureobasidium pullulans]